MSKRDEVLKELRRERQGMRRMLEEGYTAQQTARAFGVSEELARFVRDMNDIPAYRVPRQRATYTEEDKVRILGLLAENDGNVKRTSRETGVPVGTIRSWRPKRATEADAASTTVE